MKNLLKNKIAFLFIVVFASWLLASCSQVILGGASSTGIVPSPVDCKSFACIHVNVIKMFKFHFHSHCMHSFLREKNL